MLIPSPSIARVNALVALPALLNAVMSVLTADAVVAILFEIKTVANNVPIVFNIVIIVDEFVMIYEKRSAAFSANFPTSSPTLSQSTLSRASPTVSIPLFMESEARSKSLIMMPSTFDWRSVSFPLTLLFMVSAISAAAPFEFVIALDSFSKSFSDPLTIARSPLMASCPAICFAAAVCSVSLKPEKASLSSSITCMSVFMFPSPSVNEMPSFSISSAHSFGGAESLLSVDLKAVPALSPLIPAFAIIPIATAVSSMS